ncbi:DUF6461 domain-containing protein [Streptomyces luteolus]|uniref:DUF6461 domain-containing protein n=1 Tax=Streptomyces luteolus TaxID=3043615 RepID=A0ABT6T101_9ACTN|nr:DUF6461 domain-containing protein [Streptomyces sp. B-S-A12]MDI3420582.1 DUF6461 domain-containing protein [Streptomyces sp. B-S-A12]
MSDGIAWIARADLSEFGYCVTLARGIGPEELVARLAHGYEVEALEELTADDLEDRLETDGSESFAVRYGQTDGGLSFAVAHGAWPGEMGPGYTDGLSNGGVEVFQFYYETENPKLPPPEFTYMRDGEYLCSFSMDTIEVQGDSPELVRALSADLEAAGVPREENRGTAHEKSLMIAGERFGLTLPKETVLQGELPTAIIGNA